MAYSIIDIQVRRVLECFRNSKRESFGRFSLKEVTTEFNQRYPPSLVNKIIGIKVAEQDILQILNFLVSQKLLEKQLFSFTDQPLPASEQMYALTQEGTRRVVKKT